MNPRRSSWSEFDEGTRSLAPNQNLAMTEHLINLGDYLSYEEKP